jgi:hypothetical protein
MAILLAVLATVSWLTFTAGFADQNVKEGLIVKNSSECGFSLTLLV